ncbi:MAG TPA: Flp family type IVb pilin [Xanthobacteraceae bacterium]|nr:Flp family type IVb pilin [Xanthobacteraceae bacterium]
MPLSGAAGRFPADRRGATSIEYALIAAGIGATVATAVYVLGAAVEGLYQKLLDAF